MGSRLQGSSILRTGVAAVLFAAGAQAQGVVTFGIDWQGPLIDEQGTGTTTRIRESDLLRTPPLGQPQFGPLPVPLIYLYGGSTPQQGLGLPHYDVCAGGKGVSCGIEVDALSFGKDRRLGDGSVDYRIWFTVDEFAVGFSLTGAGPSLETEAQIGDSASDLFMDLGLAQLPIQPGSNPGANVGRVDGNGLYPRVGGLHHVYRGVGTLEPLPPASGDVVPGTSEPGDNVDCFDVDEGGVDLPGSPVFFSLGGNLPDLDEGFPAGTDSAVLNGVQAADVLLTRFGAFLGPYAFAQQLGLDIAGGPGSDDIDALIVWENGQLGYQPPTFLFSWNGSADPTDMIVFSVRKGSAVIGQPDSIWGRPIQPGDLLVPPMGPGPGFPGIIIPGDALGLADGDDMDGADATDDPFQDCNGNGIDDAYDIVVGSSADDNLNGIPDECEERGTRYCFCAGTSAICGNPAVDAGCANSTGVGATLRGIGSASVSLDDFMLIAEDVPLNKYGIFFMGGNTIDAPFGDGRRCVAGGSPGIFRFPIQNSGGSGTMTQGPELTTLSCDIFLPAGCIFPSDTWYFQAWFRDPSGPCGSAFNTSNGLGLTFAP